MAQQVAVNIQAEIKPGEEAQTRSILKEMGANPAGNQIIPFGDLSGVHFGRIFIIDEVLNVGGVHIPPTLVYMIELDAPLDNHLKELVQKAGKNLNLIFSHCQGYPVEPGPAGQDILKFFKDHQVNPAAYYVNTVGRTLNDVRQEARLREAIEDFLDRPENNWNGRSALEIRQTISEFVKSQPEFNWAGKPASGPGLWFRVREMWHMLWVPLVIVLLIPFLIIILPVLAIAIRLLELKDPEEQAHPSDEHIQELAALEDYAAQNQFSAAGFIKTGWVRLVTVKTVLLLLDYAVRHVFNKENLAGVKTIHFARWVSLNDNRRVLFTSNYDGSLESYMDDFIDKLAWGLNAVFSNGRGYPKTSWLLFGGASNELAFKNYLRQHQLPTQV